MKIKLLVLLMTTCLLGALQLGAQCMGGDCLAIDVWVDADLPDCWVMAHCSTDADFFDPCGKGFVVANCNGGVGTGTCVAGSGSTQGWGAVYCDNKAINDNLVANQVDECCP